MSQYYPPVFRMRVTRLSMLLLCTLLTYGCSLTATKSSQATASALPSDQTSKLTCNVEGRWQDIPAYKASDLLTRIINGYQLPEIAHKRIDSQRDWYLKHPAYLKRVLNRGEPYLFHIVEQLDKRNLPMELAFLPIVESAFDPFAYSHGRASGIWQIIPGTGKMLGLKQNWWYDGRRDVVASTDAALNYLERLNKRFNGDWLLALASYNSGAGNVSKAIRANKKRGKPTTFFHLDLPKETKAYVPKLLALAEIFRNADGHNLALDPISNTDYFSSVNVGSQIDLAQAATLSEISMETLYKLNPAYNRWATDPNGSHDILVPVEKQQIFQANLSQIPAAERVVWQRYTIKNGDTLSGIAKKFNVSGRILRDANKMNNNFLRAGKNLMVPVAAAGAGHYTASIEERLKKTHSRVGKKKSTTRVNHTVASGDNLWDLSKRYGVSTRKIAKWNNMAPTDTLRLGQVLAIWPTTNASVPASSNTNNNVVRKVAYRVRNGDSIHRIADKFRINVNDILRWNNLNPKKYLQPGQSITLFVDVTN